MVASLGGQHRPAAITKAGNGDIQVLFPRRCPALGVAEAIKASCAIGRPGFFVDMANLRRRLTVTTEVAARYGVRVLFAVKSCGNDEILRAAADSGVGFDISNNEEFEIVASRVGGRPFVSLTSPGLAKEQRERVCRMIRAGHIARFYCDSLRQLSDFCGLLRGSEVGIRVNLNGEAITDGVPVYAPSRFGVRLNELKTARDIAASADCRIRWIHLHNASEFNELSSYVTAARLMLQRSHEAGIDVAALDLGGGLREPADERSLGAFFGALRSVIPDHVELILEPGHFWLSECGYLSAQVLDVKAFDTYLVLVTDCGALNHLQWSYPELPVLGPIARGDRRPYLMCGRTCFERDVVGQIAPSPGYPAPLVDDWLVLGEVSGYSAELGSSFNGVPARAPILLPG